MTAYAKKSVSPYGAVALRKELIDELDRLAEKMGLSRDELAEKALLIALEDFEDAHLADEAIKAWTASGKETVSLDDVERRLDLDR